MLAAQEAPGVIRREGRRIAAAEGVASGDVGHDRAMVWSRCDRPGQMVVEWATTESFREVRRVMGPAAVEASDFTAKLDLRGLLFIACCFRICAI
jgi:alkaline phosphatase D